MPFACPSCKASVHHLAKKCKACGADKPAKGWLKVEETAEPAAPKGKPAGKPSAEPAADPLITLITKAKELSGAKGTMADLLDSLGDYLTPDGKRLKDAVDLLNK